LKSLDREHFRKLQIHPAGFSEIQQGLRIGENVMADGSGFLTPAETIAVDVLPIYQSQLERIATAIAQHHWHQEQVADYGLNPQSRVLQQALLNVISQHLEAMLVDWVADDWIRGDLGTNLQAEIKRLGN
jgi:hypothetical protein